MVIKVVTWREFGSETTNVLQVIGSSGQIKDERESVESSPTFFSQWDCVGSKHHLHECSLHLD